MLVDADYSQIELRILAHLSDDKAMIDAFRSGEDIHTVTASQVFDQPIEWVTPEMRRSAKAVNFGVIYGMSGFGLAEELTITRKQAEKYIKDYFERFKGVKAFMDRQVAECKATGSVRTLYGRKRDIPEINASQYMVRQLGERLAMNSPIQGTAADIIKIAMIKVSRELKERKLKSRLILQIHDELLIEAPEDEKDVVSELLKRNMEEALELAVPLFVDLHTGYSLFDAK